MGRPRVFAGSSAQLQLLSPDLYLGSVKKTSARDTRLIKQLFLLLTPSCASCRHHGDASTVTRLRRQERQIGASVRPSVAQTHRQRSRRCTGRSALSGICRVSKLSSFEVDDLSLIVAVWVVASADIFFACSSTEPVRLAGFASPIRQHKRTPSAHREIKVILLNSSVGWSVKVN